MSSSTPEFSIEDRDKIDETINFIKSLPYDRNQYPDLHDQVIETSTIVQNEISLRAESIMASLLYRFVQYELISDEVLLSTFGEKVATLVSGVMKIAVLKKSSLTYQTDNFIQLVLTLSPDPRAILIMLAEQLNKMRRFEQLDETYHEQVLQEIHNLYAPIAHRLGLYAIKTELEEQWMKRAYYPTFRDIADQLAAKKPEREAFIKSFIAPLNEKIKDANISAEIKGRPKSIFSIWNKMKNQKVGVDGVYDKFAIRIIIDCDSIEDEKELCWKVYSLVTEEYTPFPKRLRDWISHPKSSGYESLHTTVQTDKGEWVEIQIRTRRMDEIAEKGHAAHWKYKESSSGTKSDWLSEMRSALEKVDEPGKESDLKSALYAQEIFVFTPDEEIKRLRRGATLLDFAFSIHTNVGLTCTGGTVNGKHVTIKHGLKNGDIVSINTSKRQTPNEEWLSLVSSSRAKAKIKRALKEKDNRYGDVGKELVKRKLEQLHEPFDAVTIQKIVDGFHVEDAAHLYEGIGDQSLDILKIKKFFTDSEEPVVQEAVEPVVESVTVKKESNHSDALVIDENISGVQYSLASCCNPIRGDEIFGFISVNKGVRIHRKSCPNARDLFANHLHRIVSAAWTRGEKQERFSCNVQITGRDEPNILSTVTNLVRNSDGVTLESLNVTPSEAHFSANLYLLVCSNEVRDELLRKLTDLKEIESAFQI